MYAGPERAWDTEEEDMARWTSVPLNVVKARLASGRGKLLTMLLVPHEGQGLAMEKGPGGLTKQ